MKLAVLKDKWALPATEACTETKARRTQNIVLLIFNTKNKLNYQCNETSQKILGLYILYQQGCGLFSLVVTQTPVFSLVVPLIPVFS